MLVKECIYNQFLIRLLKGQKERDTTTFLWIWPAWNGGPQVILNYPESIDGSEMNHQITPEVHGGGWIV